MKSSRKEHPCGLVRPPAEQGTGRTQLDSPTSHVGLSQVSQASPGHAYWLTKRQRKNRKNKRRKEPLRQTQQKTKKPFGLNILQANVEGIKKKKTELEKVMNDNQVHIALLQETLHANVDLHITGYTPYPCKCGTCRGIITYVRNDVQCDVSPHLADSPNDIIRATVWYENKKYSIPSLNRHLWGFSKLAAYPVWRFKEVSNVGGQDFKKKEQSILTCVGKMITIA